MNPHEYALQRDGTAAAFRDPAISNLIALSSGGVIVSVVQWAGPDEQDIVVPWTSLHTNADSVAFASLVERAQDLFHERTGTAIGNSLRHAISHLNNAPTDCLRTVLDISGDGISNIGLPTLPQAQKLAMMDVSVNGLVIPAQGDMKVEDPYMFYVDHVSIGPSSFVVDVASYQDYARAIRKKLLREIRPLYARN